MLVGLDSVLEKSTPALEALVRQARRRFRVKLITDILSIPAGLCLPFERDRAEETVYARKIVLRAEAQTRGRAAQIEVISTSRLQHVVARCVGEKSQRARPSRKCTDASAARYMI